MSLKKYILVYCLSLVVLYCNSCKFCIFSDSYWKFVIRLLFIIKKYCFLFEFCFFKYNCVKRKNISFSVVNLWNLLIGCIMAFCNKLYFVNFSPDFLFLVLKSWIKSSNDRMFLTDGVTFENYVINVIFIEKIRIFYFNCIKLHNLL